MAFIVQLLIILIACIVILLILKHKKSRKSRYIYASAFFVALIVTMLLKSNLEAPLVNEFIPFYKLFNINEYGYAGFLTDLLNYALPFVLPGLLFIPAFPKCGVASAFLAGITSSLVLNLPSLIMGGRFVSDECIYAGIGLAVGCALYAIMLTLLHKSKFIGKLRLPRPRRKAYTFGIGYLVAIYFGIALVLILDYGTAYAPIQFYESETPLPQTHTLNCELSTEEGTATIYSASTQSVTDRVYLISRALGIEGEIVETQGIYTVEMEGKRLSYTQSGSWNYEYTGYPTTGTTPSEESALEAVFSFFESRTLLTVKLNNAFEIVERYATGGGFEGYDIYLSTQIGGYTIEGSCTLVVSVRQGNQITKIRKYDGDLATRASKSIISEQAAYDRFLSGDGAYTLFSSASQYTIDSCEMVYIANSSQGYYLPVWCFRCTATLIDGTLSAFEIYVEALK